MRTTHREATVYDTTTRSTLEARWAIFFRELGLKWIYEPERISGYLPDFKIEGFGYVEIKPTLDLFISESSERIRKVARDNSVIKIYVFCADRVSLETVALYQGDKIFAPNYRQVQRELISARIKIAPSSVHPLSSEAQDAFVTRAIRIANTTSFHSDWKTMTDVLPEVVEQILTSPRNCGTN